MEVSYVVNGNREPLAFAYMLKGTILDGRTWRPWAPGSPRAVTTLGDLYVKGSPDAGGRHAVLRTESGVKLVGPASTSTRRALTLPHPRAHPGDGGSRLLLRRPAPPPLPWSRRDHGLRGAAHRRGMGTAGDHRLGPAPGDGVPRADLRLLRSLRRPRRRSLGRRGRCRAQVLVTWSAMTAAAATATQRTPRRVAVVHVRRRP